MSDNTKMSIDAKAHLVDGYDAQPANRRTRARLAATFQENPFNERLIVLKRENPAGFATLGTTTRLSLGSYIEAKRAYQELNQPDETPEAAR